jgi:predicted CopG family antitoxin
MKLSESTYNDLKEERKEHESWDELMSRLLESERSRTRSIKQEMRAVLSEFGMEQENPPTKDNSESTDSVDVTELEGLLDRIDESEPGDGSDVDDEITAADLDDLLGNITVSETETSGTDDSETDDGLTATDMENLLDSIE